MQMLKIGRRSPLTIINFILYLRFCDHHGAKDLSVQSAPPAELLAMAQIVVPRLCLRLQKQLKEMDPFIIIGM